MDTTAFVSTAAGIGRLGCLWFFGLLALAGWFFPHPAEAQLSPENVLVLYNAADAESHQVASYYAGKRPGVQLLGLTGVTTAEQVTADYYLANIRPQILAALDDSIDVIVTTKGLPLRIKVSQSRPTGTYTDPFGVVRSVTSANWRPYSSLESELTRIDTISTWQQMGDQTTFTAPAPVRTINPFYSASTDFSFQQFGVRLSSRLDGFSVNDVQGMIDRAQRAFISAGSATDPFHFVIDDDPNAAGSTADQMEALRDDVLAPRGLPYTYDGTDAFIQDPAVAHPGAVQVIGYVTHGTHGGAPSDYLVDPVDGIHFQPANGAVFHSWESYNAITFDPDVSHSQGLAAEWIQRGGTAALGHVAEPYVGTYTVSREDILFDRLLSGMNWVEAAWSSTFQLSYVNTVVGDPLMQYRVWVPGDLTFDGIVNMADFIVMQQHWLQSAAFAQGDLTGDGYVNVADFMVMQQHWLQTCDGAGQGSGMSSTIILDPLTGEPEMVTVPEPTSWVLLGGAALTLLTTQRCRLRRSQRTKA
jgi:uncharacterized protein (TIGR03790 family)